MGKYVIPPLVWASKVYYENLIALVVIFLNYAHCTTITNGMHNLAAIITFGPESVRYLLLFCFRSNFIVFRFTKKYYHL